MQVNLTWTASTDPLFQFYNVFRSQTSGQDYDKIATNLTQNNFQDGPGSLVNGASYFYVITAVTSDGEGLFSNEYAAGSPAIPVTLSLSGTTT